MINGNAKDLQDQLIDEFEIRPQPHNSAKGVVNGIIIGSLMWATIFIAVCLI